MLMTGGVTALILAALLAPRLPRLRQRYDRKVLSPFPKGAHPVADTARDPVAQALDRWAHEGCGSGATLLPWARPVLPTPLAWTRLEAESAPQVYAFGYRLAGYHQLDERSRLGGILYRVRVQLQPLLWFVARAKDAPWDDAWLEHAEPDRMAALATWQPRRPTLIVLAGEAAMQAEAYRRYLEKAALDSEHPIRVLALTRS